jgi:hypothetical protein
VTDPRYPGWEGPDPDPIPCKHGYAWNPCPWGCDRAPDPDPLFTAEDELASYDRRRPGPALVLALVVGGLVVAFGAGLVVGFGVGRL